MTHLNAQFDSIRQSATVAMADRTYRTGVDTAVGRYVTTLTLRVDAPADAERAAEGRLEINHAAYVTPPPTWLALFDAVAALVARAIGERDRQRLVWLGATFPVVEGPFR